MIDKTHVIMCNIAVYDACLYLQIMYIVYCKFIYSGNVVPLLN